jgi:hypothetical protein
MRHAYLCHIELSACSVMFNSKGLSRETLIYLYKLVVCYRFIAIYLYYFGSIVRKNIYITASLGGPNIIIAQSI